MFFTKASTEDIRKVYTQGSEVMSILNEMEYSDVVHEMKKDLQEALNEFAMHIANDKPMKLRRAQQLAAIPAAIVEFFNS